MPRKLEMIIADARKAAKHRTLTKRVMIHADDLNALCDAAERSMRSQARVSGPDRMNDPYVVPASATHGPR